MHTEGGVYWGLDYLFGLVDFTAFWAHTIRDERQALVDFLEMIRTKREQHPGMHVYHYAAYERRHLLSLAARHGVGEDDVDELLRAGVLVDLCPIVCNALVVGSPIRSRSSSQIRRLRHSRSALMVIRYRTASGIAIRAPARLSRRRPYRGGGAGRARRWLGPA